MPSEHMRLTAGHRAGCLAVAAYERRDAASPWTLVGSTWERSDNTLWLIVLCNDRDCSATLKVRWDRVSGWIEYGILRPIERARTVDPLRGESATTDTDPEVEDGE